MPAKKKTTTPPPPKTPNVERGDSLQNLLTGMGTERDARMFTTIQRSAVLTVTDLDTVFTEGDLEHNIVSVPADDMTREWIDLQSDDERSAMRIEKELDRLGARRAMREGITWARLTGGAVVVMGLAKQKAKVAADGSVMNEPDLSLPAQPGRVEWLQVYDRFEVQSVEVGDDGEISHYVILVDDEETERIHASRCLRFDTEPVPRRMRSEAGWGCSVLDRCKEPIQNLDTAMAGVSVAVSRFSETVMKIDKLTELLAADKGGVAKKKLQLLNQMRSMFGMIVLDGNDEMVEVSRQFGGVAEMLDRLIERVASAARMPVSKLMGRAPAGLNATGDSDVRNWYDFVASMQETDLRPVLTSLCRRIAEGLKIQLADEEAQGEGAGVTLTIVFNPLWKPTSTEVATMHLTQAQADDLYIANGTLSSDVVAKARFSPTGYSLETTLDPADLTTADPSKVDPADLNPDNLDENGNPKPPSTTSGGAPGVDIQKTALNGAQVASAQGIVVSVAKRELPRATGLGMLEAFFNLSPADALKVMGPVGETFFAPSPADPTPAG